MTKFDRPSFDVDRLLSTGKLKKLYELLRLKHRAEPDPEGLARLHIEQLLENAFRDLSTHYDSAKNAAMKALVRLQKEALQFYDHVLHTQEKPDVARLEQILRDMDSDLARLSRKVDDVAADVPRPATKQSAKVPDPQRQVKAAAAKEALDVAAEADRASFRDAGEDAAALAQRIKKLAAERKVAPPELKKALDKLPPIDEIEARLDAVRELAAQPGHSPAAAEYLRWQEDLLSARAELKDIAEGGQAGKRVVERRETVDRPAAEKELKTASKPVRELLRTEGPNYRKKSDVTFDEIIGEKEWAQMRGELPPEGRLLATDHLVPLDQIGNSPELTRFLELFERAPDDLKEAMTKDLINIGDRPDNLVRMRADANGSKLKTNKKWADLTYDQARAFGYDAAHVDLMRAREATVAAEITKAVNELTTKYDGILSGRGR